MTVEFIEYNPKTMIQEGRYWIVTDKKHGNNFMSAKVTQATDNRMSVDVTNQIVTHISREPCQSPT